MEYSSQKNLSRYSRGLERHTQNAIGEPERKTAATGRQHFATKEHDAHYGIG